MASSYMSRTEDDRYDPAGCDMPNEEVREMGRFVLKMFFHWTLIVREFLFLLVDVIVGLSLLIGMTASMTLRLLVSLLSWFYVVSGHPFFFRIIIIFLLFLFLVLRYSLFVHKKRLVVQFLTVTLNDPCFLFSCFPCLFFSTLCILQDIASSVPIEITFRDPAEMSWNHNASSGETGGTRSRWSEFFDWRLEAYEMVPCD